MNSPLTPAGLLQHIDYAVSGGIAVITINRPQVRNALAYRSYEELEWAFRTASLDPEVRCVIVTGAEPAFCAGDDMREVMSGSQSLGGGGDTPVQMDEANPASLAVLECACPVIAAVNGVAVGWGMELAIYADLRIASETARFGQMVVKRGLLCDIGSFSRLPLLVGPAKAAELLFVGSIIDAHEALRIGLVSEVVAKDALLQRAKSIAGAIAHNPPLAVRGIKEGLRLGTETSARELGSWLMKRNQELARTDDHKEGVSSFFEKRQPVFRGR